MTLMVCKKKRSKIEKKTKWWKLKKEECCEEFRQKLRQALGGQIVLPDDWETTAEVIRETGRKVLGVSPGRRKEDKETWWWNEEVQDSIQRKRLAKKKWDMDRIEENRQEYMELQRRVKREVSKAKQKAYDELYTRDGQRELHCVFVDLEKAYDRVPREELWYCMRKSGVAEKYVRVVQDMYERSRTVVRCAVGQTEEFKAEVGLHQGSALSPFLFAIVMDQLSEEVRQESPWTMMFADDIVICSESREQVKENLERWRFVLERRGMKVRCCKTEYMCVNEREGSGTVRLQGEEVKKVQEFKYLGSTVQSNGECGKEVKKRVQAETESELEVAELKMLRFSLGVTKLDRIRNEYIRGTAHVGHLGDKVREARLRWFGHVQRRENFQNTVRVCDVTESASVPVLQKNRIKGNLLPSALIWITSRPAAADKIPSECVHRVTEVRGFSDPQKEEYFTKRISDQSLANKIIKHLKSLRSLYIMCHIPVFCWISATVLERMLGEAESGEIPKTLT
ncbi:hypothetical protein QTP86_010144 [Hemibagrus guttatus]|nr:hypothetical protein QTP86_010144 [Hemibagrus guttatus]